MKDYKLKITVRNNRILKAIEEAGFSSQAEFCREFNLFVGNVNAIVSMRRSPIMKNGRLRQHAQEICEALGKLPEDLWNDDQLYTNLYKNSVEVEASTEEMQMLVENKTSIRQLLDKANLKPRMAKVLKMRYLEEKTLDEVGDKLNVSAQRIRQISEKGLRILRGYAANNNVRYEDFEH